MRLVTLILLLVPGYACAMPVAIPAIIAALGYSAVVVAIAQVVVAIGMLAYGQRQKKKRERQERDNYNSGLQDRTITRVATEAPHVYVYGRSKVGSAIVAMFQSGDKDQYKHLVCVHAAHECDAIEEIYVAGKALGTLDSDGYVTSGDYFSLSSGFGNEYIPGGQQSITLAHTPDSLSVQAVRVGVMLGDDGAIATVPFTLVGNVLTLYEVDPNRLDTALTYTWTRDVKRVRVRKHLGTPSDTADAFLMSQFPGVWTADAVLRGFCYTVITLDLNQPEFQQGIPPIEVLLRGKKLYDPRSGLTTWSQNPALVIYDYLQSEVCNVDAADIPASQYITAANVCDEATSFGALYTFNGTVTSDQPQGQVLELMAQSMAGSIVSTTWEITAGKYVAPVMALTKEDIVGSMAVAPGVSDADLYNGVRGQYISSETAYIANDFIPFQNPTYAAVDGRDLWQNIDFPFTDSVQRAHNLCRVFVEDQRNGYTVKAELSLKAWKLKVGQRVTWTHDTYGWSSKVFRVVEKRFSPSSAVELTLKEDAPGIWDFADSIVADETPNTNLVNPFAISPLQYLTCESGTDALLAQQDGTMVSRILVLWSEATTQAVFTNGTIEIEWLRLGSDIWQKTQATGSDTRAYLHPVEDGSVYVVRARTVNPYLNIRSDWTYAALHMVIGKTAPPPNITDLSISGSVLNWSEVVALDLRGYIFRFHYGNNRDWGSAVALHTGVITSSPFDLITRPSGMVTIMGRAVDTTGNESLSSAIIVTNLGDIPVANVVETFDLQADNFPGALTGGTLSSGVLVADATDSAYGTDDQSFYGADNDPAYDLSTYTKMIYVTEEIAVNSALSGSLMTLEFESQGTDLTIEYRLSGPGPAYGVDGDSAYGADDDSFYGAPGSWIPWPGQIVAANDVYQFCITIGAGVVQGQLNEFRVVIDAPDIVEYLEDVPISAGGTIVPYTSNFTAIKTVTPTLQANASSAITIEADKTVNLSPILKAYNAAHTAVSGATADIIVKGY